MGVTLSIPGCVLTWGASTLPPGLPSGTHAFSEIDRHSLSERATFVRDSVARNRGHYHFEDYLGYPELEHPEVLRLLRTQGYPTHTDSAYWNGFDRALDDVRQGVFRFEVTAREWIDRTTAMAYRNAVLIGWFGVSTDSVQGYFCYQQVDEAGNDIRPTCLERHAERIGYNRAVNLTVGLFFGHSDLLQYATERGIGFELER